MNQENLEHLQKSLFYLGFGDKLNTVLEDAIKKAIPQFTLTLNKTMFPPGVIDPASKENISYALDFAKDKEKDVYYLNNINVELTRPYDLDKNQRFSNDRNAFTAKEIYNLLSGRSVNKDLAPKEQGGEKVNVWRKLDLEVKDSYNKYPVNTFYPQYGFNLEKAVAKYPVAEIQDPKKSEELFASLKKGNLAPATLTLNGKPTEVLLAANPEMKGIDVYDKRMVEIRDYHIWPELAKHQSEGQSRNGQQDAVQSGISDEQATKTRNKKTPATGTTQEPWVAAPGETEGPAKTIKR